MAANWQKKSNLYPFVNTAAAGPSGGDTMLYVSGSSESTLSGVPSISEGVLILLMFMASHTQIALILYM